jgi:2,3-bisphosphoglycerate-dependent phosphoglycerate mutase
LNIYVVRHCKAEGQSPSANLTEEGYLQAELVAEFLHGKNIENIISSPFLRAIQSISPLAEKIQVKLHRDDRLSERILCGESSSNWLEMLRHTFTDLELCYEGGESSITAMNRALAVITDVKNSGLSNVVIVTHGNLMSLLLKYYDNKFGFEEWASLSNPDVYHLHFEGELPIIQRVWNS